MSRDVAYRNGYLPLFAGAELIRRSGSLTQFPAENLIGTLPGPPAGFHYVYTAPPGLAGSPIARGFPNSKADAIYAAGGVFSFWPVSGYEPTGVIAEGIDYRRVRGHLYTPEGTLEYSFIPGTGTGTFLRPGLIGGDPPIETPYTSTLTVAGRAMVPSVQLYPSGQYATMDDYLTACNMPPITVGDNTVGTVEWELTWPLDQVIQFSTGFRTSMVMHKDTDTGTDWSTYWGFFFLPEVPFPAEKFSLGNTVQSLFGGIDVIFAEVWNAADSLLTAQGLDTKAQLHAQSPDVPPVSFTTVAMPYRNKAFLTDSDKAFLAGQGLDWTLLPASNTITDPLVGMIGPSYVNMVATITSTTRDASGVWREPSISNIPSAGILSVNLQGSVSPANTLQTLLTSVTAQVKAILVAD